MDDAIVFYEKALKENPSNKKYLQALTKAKQDLAMIHYRKSKESLAAKPDPSFPELSQIFKDVDRARTLDPENKAITNLFNDLTNRKDDLLATIKSLYTQAESSLANEEWMDAIQKFRRVSKLFPGYEDTRDKLAGAEDRAAEIFYKQG